MRKGYRAFLLGTATDQNCRAFKLAERSSANELFAGLRKWGKVISSEQH